MFVFVSFLKFVLQVATSVVQWALDFRTDGAKFSCVGLKNKKWFVLVALLASVLALFFFPLPFGGFQSTHGPTSTLDSGSLSHDLTLAIFTFQFPTIVLAELQPVEFEAAPVVSEVVGSRCALLCTFRC